MMTSNALLSKLVSHEVQHSWSAPGIDLQTPPERFNEFEIVIDKIDAENKELFILGDVNCNLLPEAFANNSSYLTSIFDIYGLSQLITEPTRVTPTSKTLIGLCITNSPEKVTNSGVIHLGISDRSLECVYDV